MDISFTWKHFAAWFVMLFASIANGAARDLLYGEYMSELTAHQLSTVTSIILLGAIIYIFVRMYPPSSDQHAIAIGLFWVTLTLAFEFLFFHFIGGHSWSPLLANYNVLAGRVWILVPIWIGIAPYLFFHLSRRS